MSGGRIQAVGAYLPMLRLERKAAAAALRWSGLPGGRSGRRAVAGWDEDALTLAVEAARGVARDAAPEAVIFASTSAYFHDRAQAPLMLRALGLPGSVRTQDVAGSRRCAVAALLQALESGHQTLIAAGERRPAKPGSAAHLTMGDGGAAVRTGASGGARLIGAASESRDFLESYASRDHPWPYPAEERFVRDMAARDILVPTLQRALATAGIDAHRVAFAVVPEPANGSYAAVAKALGLTAPNLASDLAAAAGDLGAAHPLFALALAFDRAQAGDVILLAGFGSGCDALVLEMDGPVAGANEAADALGHGTPLTDYVRFLSLTGSLELDWGVRAETEQKAQASVAARHGEDAMGFVGGRAQDGSVQFPKSPIPVGGGRPEPLEDVRLADEPAKIVSITADRLNFSPDPPFRFGLVQFANGARVLMEYADVEGEEPAPGDPVTMRFRIKAHERRRGFRTYFWKAVPLARPQLGAS